jgi:hypothetical protein
MNWTVEIADEFEPEFDALDEDVQVEILALSRLLLQFGPQLGRPARGHAERLTVREHEGAAVQRGGWGMATCLRL